MPIKHYAHVDEFLDDPETQENEFPAKLWLEKFRAPAHKVDTQWLNAFQLLCRHEGVTHRVVGCSCMGDIWLTSNLMSSSGYEKRVSINGCSDWKMSRVPGAPVDHEVPWRINAEGIVVDCCNHPVLDTTGDLEKVVEAHNAAIKPFKPSYDLDEDAPAGESLDGDPVSDTRIAESEGWVLVDIDHVGIAEIQRMDTANVFASDAEAVRFVQCRANAASPYHQKAIALHRKHSENASYYRDGHMIEKAKLERMEQIAKDTKKSFSYDKSDGTWAWFDCDEADVTDAWNKDFPTRFDALMDAVEPYLNEDGDC